LALGTGFGVCIPNFGGSSSQESIVKVARSAEELGYDSVWVTDHVMLPRHQSYPYGRTYEAIVTLSYVAALTTKIRLGTSILVLPMRNPVITAKQLASLDDLSGGRVIAGLAVGWSEDEFNNLGARFEGRGRVFSESIKLIKALWSDKHPTFLGEYHKIANVVFDPVPRQPKGPPIWIGGNSATAARRAAALSDGWHPTGIPLDEFIARVNVIRKRLPRGFTISGRFTVDLTGKTPRETKSRTGERRTILSGDAEHVIRMMDEYVKAGLSYFVLYFGEHPSSRTVELLREFERDVAPSFR